MENKDFKTSDTQIVARIIKQYIMTHQGCTSKEINHFLASHNFGLRTDYTSYKIGKLIHYCTSRRNHAYLWFKNSVIIEKRYGMNVYFVKEK